MLEAMACELEEENCQRDLADAVQKRDPRQNLHCSHCCPNVQITHVCSEKTGQPSVQHVHVIVIQVSDTERAKYLLLQNNVYVH